MQALDVLTDSRKRQAFDSEEELLEISIPSMADLQDPTQFFRVMRPIFARFSYFSVRKPVPELGDEESPIEEVEKFYEFWNGFQSWRDFSHEDEYDPEEASCREEKRWMERVRPHPPPPLHPDPRHTSRHDSPTATFACCGLCELWIAWAV